MSSADAVLTTLLLQSGRVRCYSNLEADIGKRVIITDKFNPLSVKTGVFDSSLNLVFDLPAFTSYNVKMYGTDGETVESDQDFKLNGYSYVEMNVGLNKNSFAGIKAIVDQGLEGTMLSVGDEFSEDDNFGDDGGRWIIVAIDSDANYNHSVFLARKYMIYSPQTASHFTFATNMYNNVCTQLLDETYYNSLPDSIKNAISPRNLQTWSVPRNASATSQGFHEHNVWAPSVSELVGSITFSAVLNSDTSKSFPETTVPIEVTNYPQFPYYASNGILNINTRPSGTKASSYLRSAGTATTSDYSNLYSFVTRSPSNTMTGVIAHNTSSASQYTISIGGACPHMMIASDPIE